MHQASYTKSLHYTTKMNVDQMQEMKESNELSKQALAIICAWTEFFKKELELDKKFEEQSRDRMIAYQKEDMHKHRWSTDQGERDLLLNRNKDYNDTIKKYCANIFMKELEISEIDELVESINIAIE